MKLITGEIAGADDPEHGVSRGRLLPSHHIFGQHEVSAEVRLSLQDSLVLVHGGMAQDIGPILEMVTEKYLLRSEAEWVGRQDAHQILDEIIDLLHRGGIQGIGAATTRNFFGPLQAIIPWASNYYTETLIERVRAAYAEQFWGFWMLGGASGSGMGFIFDPTCKEAAQDSLHEIMLTTKHQLEMALPFAIEPVVYDFAINERGTYAELLDGNPGSECRALMPPGYYTLTVPHLLRRERHELSPVRLAELDVFGAACRTQPELSGMVQTLFDYMIPRASGTDEGGQSLEALLDAYGFDRIQHEQIRGDLRSGRIGLAQNRLPVSADIRDAAPSDVTDRMDLGVATDENVRLSEVGMQALAEGQLAIVTLAAGAGSRWTHGAGVVKALHPFCKLGRRHRTFVEVHLAKSRRIGSLCDAPLPHVITTSFMTHGPIQGFLADQADYGYGGPLVLSPGRAVGLRLVPMTRDLRFAWEEMPQQLLDEQAQKVLDSLHAALIGWAEQTGEGTDYVDNLPLQCLHPVGHWFEIPNMFRNGVLVQLLRERPQLQYLLLHNIDTVGVDADPIMLGDHITSGATMSIEVITRRVEDRGGGLACLDGHLRLLEGMALPREEDEFRLSYYNSASMWISIDRLLEVFGLTRASLEDGPKVAQAVRAVGARMPTYVTLKDVIKRWGHGQEDIFPVAQFEKLWGDMTALPEMDCRYVVVPRQRGQQLKEQAQLDGWLRDGSAAYVEALCEWE
jgi:hypothetical protein